LPFPALLKALIVAYLLTQVEKKKTERINIKRVSPRKLRGFLEIKLCAIFLSSDWIIAKMQLDNCKIANLRSNLKNRLSEWFLSLAFFLPGHRKWLQKNKTAL